MLDTPPEHDHNPSPGPSSRSPVEDSGSTNNEEYLPNITPNPIALTAEEEVFDTVSNPDSRASSPDADNYDREWDVEAEWLASLTSSYPEPDTLAPTDLLVGSFQREAAETRMFSIPFWITRLLTTSPGHNVPLSEAELQDICAFNYKVDTCIPVTAFDKLPRAFPGLELSTLFRIQAAMARLSGIKPERFDCCENLCLAYTGQYEELDTCPFCAISRYRDNGKPRKQFLYLPFISRLTSIFSSAKVAPAYNYRAQHDRDPGHRHDRLCDTFDGHRYQQLRSENVVVDGNHLLHRFFSDDRDMALGLSIDGFCPFRRRNQTCWPILLFNYNLGPDIRFHMANLLCVGVIPGPKQMTDVDSFLFPLIRDLKTLARGVRAYDIRRDEIFAFHAYLILIFGDIPAMAKLMSMKGHNALCPCRMCTIKGIRIPASRNPIYYVPLRRPSNLYDPLALPLRSQRDFLISATKVVTENIAARAEAFAREFGIKGIPALSAVPGLSIPMSYPYDFMHLIWENVIQSLILLWTNEFKTLDTTIPQPFHIRKTVWEAIGEATAAAGATLPAAFGCRVPNVAKKRSECSAEAWSIWTTFIAPVLLERRFERKEFYDHFLHLVNLVNVCLQFEISKSEIRELRTGFARWVEEYERFGHLRFVLLPTNLRFHSLYYMYDVQRLATCTLNIHALLHIADSIEACGPVWCYWAYPMERFCGALLRTMKSRRFPFTSLDKRVCDLAQLSQIKTLFDLHEELDLSTCRKVEENGIRIAGCEFFPCVPDCTHTTGLIREYRSEPRSFDPAAPNLRPEIIAHPPANPTSHGSLPIEGFSGTEGCVRERDSRVRENPAAGRWRYDARIQDCGTGPT